jgi:phosphoglucosamine mutase
VKTKAVFGGEPCGAWIHPQVHYCPDGILSSIMLLEALEDENKELSELVAEAPAYPMIRENLPCKNDKKYEVVEKAGQELRSAFGKCKDFSKLDGIRFSCEEGWILIRASGTEPVIRLTVEGESLNAAKRIMRKGITLTRKLIKEA